MHPTNPPYFSHLLRLWQAGDGDQAQWRVSLEDPHTRKLRGFASLEELYSFLKQKTVGESDEDKQDDPHS